MHAELQHRFIVDKYRKDALFMLTEYTRSSKYRRLAELLLLLSNVQESMSKISLETIFFRHLIHRISMTHLLKKIIHYLPTLLP